MDQTTKPLLIPPEFALYSEKHGIFELYQVNQFLEIIPLNLILIESLFLKRMLSNLIIHKPDDPIQFLIEFLKKDANCKLMLSN